ncbi:MAG: hypothetical protein ACI9EW_001394 [Cellvibrionaceae bacterium]|jgi:hypothetical protein
MTGGLNGYFFIMISKRYSLAWPTIFTFIIVMGWMAFEGILWLVVSIGIVLTIIWVWVGLKQVRPKMEGWLVNLTGFATIAVLWSAAGAFSGFIAPLSIVALMVFKTGIHSHGPEFSPYEIEWVLSQSLRWGLLGLLAGFGVGLVEESLA